MWMGGCIRGSTQGRATHPCSHHAPALPDISALPAVTPLAARCTPTRKTCGAAATPLTACGPNPTAWCSHLSLR